MGRVLFFKRKSEETLRLVKDKFLKALEGIEDFLVRSGYKLWILKNYLILKGFF